MAISRPSARQPPDGSQVTTISASGEMREATAEEAEALHASARFAAAERARRDGSDAVSEPLDDPRMEAPVEKTTPARSTKPARRSSAKSGAGGKATKTRPPETPAPEAQNQTRRPPPMTLNDAMASARSDAALDILRGAGERALLRDGDRTHSIGIVLILQAALAVGMRMPPRTASSPRWLVDFAVAHGASPERLAAHGAPPFPARNAGVFRLRLAAAAAVRRARALASATIGDPNFDARHLLLAALDHEDRETAEQIRRTFLAGGLDLAAFRDDLLGRILESPFRNEDVRVWQRLRDDRVSGWRAIMRVDAAATRPTATIASLNTDRVSIDGADPLGIQADVSAFARLICLEEATPPLSIGLFGEWGSGKSSFMERLQGEIASLTRKEREAREKAAEAAKTGPPSGPDEAKPPAPRFVENVVQIRFNAWHYADANLWASLTAEFFDQLRRGGHAGQRSSDYLALIGKVADRVRSLEAGVKLADGALATAAAVAKQADKALTDAREKLAASDLAVASEHLGKELKDFQKENAASLKEVGTRVYRTDLSKDIDGLTAAVSEAASIPGKIALLSRVLASGGAATWLAVAAVVLVAAAGLGWRAADPASLAVLVQRMVAWGTGALAALGALWQATASVRPVLDGAWRYAKAVEAARKQLAKDVAEREKEADDARKKLAAAEEAAQKAKIPLAQYGDGKSAAAGAPGTILRYFLFEDGDIRDYDKQVGLVSRARRSFEQLDAIFSAARDGRAAKEKQERSEALSEAEKKALERYEAMQLDEQGVKIPDRIVLYIDDLDRCSHAQVYDVLQAIHLLLAFELFVVVVGVDVRWVEEAVARQFATAPVDLPDSATTAEREAAQKRRETEQRKRAIDYLEKIFQLPFWLRRLTTEGAQGGSYGAYVKDLLKANLEVAENAPSPLAPLKVAAKKGLAAGGVAGTGELLALDSLIGPEDESVAEAEELASIDLALATVRLTQAEVDFLASPEIGAIAFKSPRAVKRMLNIYRIVRARLSEAELDDFLGRAGKPPTWPIAAFLAAVETGQPVEVADALYRGVSTEEPWERFDIEHMSTILPGDRQQATNGFAALAEAESLSGGALKLGVASMDVARGGSDDDSKTPTIEDVLAMARIVRRYSFNRYH